MHVSSRVAGASHSITLHRHIGTGHRLRLASAGLAVTTATVATAGAGGLLGLIGGLLAVVGAASIAVAESCRKSLVPCTQPSFFLQSIISIN